MKRKKRAFKYKKYGYGTPLVIIPGLDGVTEFFEDIVPELSCHFTVIVYHLPLLAEAKAVGEKYTFDFIVRDLKKVFDDLSVKKAHIIAESFGGVVTQIFALRHPDSVKRLILISTAPHFEISGMNRFLMKFLPITPQWLFARVHVKDVCEPGDPEWARSKFIREASWADRSSVMARINIVSRVDLRDKISEIKMPALLVVGGADRFTGEVSEKMCNSLNNCKIVEIEGGGHLCHMTHPDKFLEETANFLGFKFRK